MPSITFLFRFRDLVAPTIKEHKIIIQEAGWCWWGWWKRPSEDARGDIWESIAEQLKTGTIDVGLFDSGTGRVYRATVEKIIPPSDDASSFVDNTIMVPNNEIDHVPRYYRDSIFSRAWLKINKIDDKSLKFFGSYSFSEAPKLHNYSLSTLTRFENKKIHSPDELRGMDTTIRHIREAQPTDSDGQILLSTQGVNEPISNEIINCKYDSILHLTDLHFALDPNRNQHIWRYDGDSEETKQTIVEAITSSLDTRKIGLLVISGDFKPV